MRGEEHPGCCRWLPVDIRDVHTRLVRLGEEQVSQISDQPRVVFVPNLFHDGLHIRQLFRMSDPPHVMVDRLPQCLGRFVQIQHHDGFYFLYAEPMRPEPFFQAQFFKRGSEVECALSTTGVLCC